MAILYVRLFENLQGYVTIKVCGDSRERFLNLCHSYGLFVWGIKNDGASYRMNLYVKDFKRIRPIVRKTGTRVSILEKKGIPFGIFKFRKRKVFAVGMIVAIFLIYGMSLFVWKIKIDGNVTQSNHEILKFLSTMDVYEGKRKSGIVCGKIEQELRKQYPNMLWVSAELQGTNIVIQIKENEDKDIVTEIEPKTKGMYSLVANVSGTIEDMIVRRGTPLVKIGDEVEAGQVLVEGYYEIKDDAGTVLRYEGVGADADIMILTKETYHDEFSAAYTSKKYTEKKRVGAGIWFGKHYYGWKPKISFENYERIKKQWKIFFTENLKFPVKFELLWYLEYIAEEKIHSAEELESCAQKRFTKKYENKIQKGVQIIEKDVKIDTNGKLCRVYGTVNSLVPATEKIPTVLPETDYEASLEGDN